MSEYEFSKKNLEHPIEYLRIFNEECLRRLGDPIYQEKVWLKGIGPEIDSIDDAIASFLVRCSAFIEQAHIQEGLNPELTEKLQSLFSKIEHYCHTSLGETNDEEITRVLSDTKWHEIQNESKILYELIKKVIDDKAT